MGTNLIRMTALAAFLIVFNATNAHATILGDILTKIDNLKTLTPLPENAASFINNYIKTNRLNTGKVLVQAWRGMADGIIKDIDAATALGLNTAPLMEELTEGPIAAIIIMEDTLVADDLGLTNAVNVLTARSQYFRNGEQSVNDELHIVYDLGISMDWYQWYLWLFYYGGIEYYDAINRESYYYSDYYDDAITGGINEYLQPYNQDDYLMPLSAFYANVNDGLALLSNNRVLFGIIDVWIQIAYANSSSISYWTSLGATFYNGILYYGPVIIDDERWIDENNVYRGYYCTTGYVSGDGGRTWVQDDQVNCVIVG